MGCKMKKQLDFYRIAIILSYLIYSIFAGEISFSKILLWIALAVMISTLFLQNKKFFFIALIAVIVLTMIHDLTFLPSCYEDNFNFDIAIINTILLVLAYIPILTAIVYSLTYPSKSLNKIYSLKTVMFCFCMISYVLFIVTLILVECYSGSYHTKTKLTFGYNLFSQTIPYFIAGSWLSKYINLNRLNKLKKDKDVKILSKTNFRKENPDSAIDLIKTYKQLLDKGIITEEEFTAKKEKILNN